MTRLAREAPAWGADGPLEGRAEAGEAYIIYGSCYLPSVIDIANNDQDVTIRQKSGCVLDARELAGARTGARAELAGRAVPCRRADGAGAELSRVVRQTAFGSAAEAAVGMVVDERHG